MSVNIQYASREDAFYDAARKKINQYFKENNISKQANTAMYAKSIFLVGLYIGSYCLIVSNQFKGWSLFFIQIVFHFDMFLMAVGIAHDGSHNSYSTHKWVNRTITYVFDFIGINSHFWSYNHLHSHHAAPNIPLIDSAIDSFSIVRLHPKTKKTFLGQYQHYYIMFVYSLVPLFQMWFIEFFSFQQNLVGYRKGDSHERFQIILLFVSKFVVVGYTLFLPMYLNDIPGLQFFMGFLAGHMVSGIALGIIFQTTHLFDKTSFPEPTEKGTINNSFAGHILQTTSEFAVENPLVTWISGGLNLHVTHHLFPNVCQIHLPAMSRIVRETAKEFDMPYVSYSFWGAIKSHLNTIKTLGNNPGF